MSSAEPLRVTIPVAAPPAIPDPWVMPSRGRVGMIALILTESAFFSIFVTAYVFYIGKSLTPPFPRDVLSPPIVNTICLLSSSITIALASRALGIGLMRRFAILWFVTLALGVEFLIGTGLEWSRLIYHVGLTIRTNLFGTTYYSLVGLHAVHVTIGALAIALVMVLTLTGAVTQEHAERVELLSWYWHFVDAVWIVVFLTVYVVGAR
ncbi:MAG: cytochrome c oxidase subunit 3 [Candidatus Binataceae bacterium]|jgi:cytochrome c oxidase subunit 3/cytochrome o ubiquinol oxidase subunit 3